MFQNWERGDASGFLGLYISDLVNSVDSCGFSQCICLLGNFEFSGIVCNQVPLAILNCTYYTALSCTVQYSLWIFHSGTGGLEIKSLALLYSLSFPFLSCSHSCSHSHSRSFSCSCSCSWSRSFSCSCSCYYSRSRSCSLSLTLSLSLSLWDIKIPMYLWFWKSWK